VQEIFEEENPDAIRMMGGFGGGIGGSGSVCGAIVGGVAALSSKYGKGTLAEKEDSKLFPLSAELYRRFATEIETSNFCRDITGTDFTKPDEIKAYIASPEKLGRCLRLVAKTTEMVRDILVREAAKSQAQGT
jgi:C_GCAxxG_C_C family probable redox protein